MGSKSSKATRRNPIKTMVVIPAKTNLVVLPRIPQEIVDEILDHLAADSDFTSLRSCALVSKLWGPSCQRHLFHTIHFAPGTTFCWSRTFRTQEESPAHYVRDLHVSTGGSDHLFFKYAAWFTKLERMTLLGDGNWAPTLWRLPQSITSLTVKTDASKPVHIRDIMAHMPNLEDLSLSGGLLYPVDRTSVGIGSTLRGRFRGRLQLSEDYATPYAVDMLLDIPTGLWFTEVKVHGIHGCLASIVRLVEGCCKTLVKLSYCSSFECKSHLLS